MILYITGSFPRLGDGIGDAAGRLYGAITDKSSIHLITTKHKEIEEYIKENEYSNVSLLTDWKYHSVKKIIRIIKEKQINKVLIEYAGNGYGRDLAISFFPLMIRIRNLFSKNKVECHLRLHEFTMCRPARKVFTYPLVMFCHHLDTPSYVEYQHLHKKYGDKVTKSSIGSNINWRETPKENDYKSGDRIKLAFFGGIYPGKGIEKLIEIWDKLEGKYPDRYEYQLLGGFSPNLSNAFQNYNDEISKLIKEKGLSEKITISGFLKDEEIEKRLDEVDIAVLPYEDGLTLRRGSFLAFLARNVAIVTSQGDKEAKAMFSNAIGVRMCADINEMLTNIEELSENGLFYKAGLDNDRFKENFEWKGIADKVLNCFNV